MDLENIGGLTTKAVSVEPRAGNPAPRVAELDEGMINSVGLANPGLERVKHPACAPEAVKGPFRQNAYSMAIFAIWIGLRDFVLSVW